MSKTEEVRNLHARRRNILYLILRYMQDAGLVNTANTMKTEARLSDEFELCDNIDLDSIYLEYASYYHLKFGKQPKILRAVRAPLSVEMAVKQQRKQTKPQTQREASTAQASTAKQQTVYLTPESTQDDKCNQELQVTVTKLDTNAESNKPKLMLTNEELLRLREVEHLKRISSISCGNNADELGSLCMSAEWQPLLDVIKSCILYEELPLSWSDIYGNSRAIELLKEAVLAPLNYPQLFVDGLKPWKSVLLHGPPGSGKTLLAKVLYAETRERVTFFNVSSSVVVSKWRGESEKLIKLLFTLAQKRAPSIIFFDEIEGLTSKRDRPTDHEASRRFKNELLQLLDGMEQHSTGVFILASTNMPWDIDEAFLRRFEKKHLVQLPNAVERAQLMAKLLPTTLNIRKEKMEKLVRLSDNFTGDEIRLACKEVAMQAVRRVTTGRGRQSDDLAIEQAFEQIKPLSVQLMGKHLKWQLNQVS